MNQTALRAVTNPNRRKILRLVWDRELSSRAIADHFNLTWPAVSQNLKVLELAGLVRTRKQGTSRFYRADRARLRPLKAVLTAMWETDIDRLAELAEEEERARRR